MSCALSQVGRKFIVAERGHQPYARTPAPSTNSGGGAMFTPAWSRPASQCSRPARRATR